MKLYCANCVDKLPEIDAGSVNFIFGDPPYPCMGREYGTMTVEAWMDMMKEVVHQSRRILKEDGSAMFIMQPSSEHVGQMRTWVWDFMSWVGKEWNIIQDVWWHNTSAQPNRHSQRKYGLMRPSVKACVWIGPPKCYRNQDEVLLPLKITKHNKTNELKRNPSGHTMREARCLDTAIERGGSTPFNMLKIPNVKTKKCAGSFGHGAGTPYKLTEWWVKYTTRPGDLVLDPFSGVATTGLVCREYDRSYIGIESFPKYHQIAIERLGL